MSRVTDLSKSLEELEGQAWGDATLDSHVVTACHRLRRMPLRELTIEDLRLAIGQGIGLTYLVPMALERLTANPLAEGDFYPGDLLQSVMRVPADFWTKHPGWLEEVERIAARANAKI